MIAAFLAFLVLQDGGLPRAPEYGKYERLTRRPAWRDTRLYGMLAQRAGGSQEADDALLSALDWLARHQDANGSWSATENTARIEITSLALRAFLDAGFTTWTKKDSPLHSGNRAGRAASAAVPAPKETATQFPDAVRRAIAFLLRSQDSSGFIGSRGSPDALRSHALGAGALMDACAEASLLILRDPAQRAIQVLAEESFSDADDATIGWALLAFRSASIDGAPFPRLVYDRLRLKPRDSSPDPALRSSVEFILWAQLPRQVPRPGPAQARSLLENLPAWEKDKLEMHRWYWGTAALFRVDAGGHWWKRWYPPLLDALLKHQETDPGEHRGSWEPGGTPLGRAGATALSALSLAVCYQMPVYGYR